MITKVSLIGSFSRKKYHRHPGIPGELSNQWAIKRLQDKHDQPLTVPDCDSVTVGTHKSTFYIYEKVFLA